MNTKLILKIIGALTIVIILIYSFIPAEKLPYDEEIKLHREELNDFMSNDQESPLPDSIKQAFQSLTYYQPNPDYRVKADLEHITDGTILEIATNDGKARRYFRFAYAHFELDEIAYKLTLLKPADDERENGLFLPFGDQSNGEETYGGGRYIDLEQTRSSTITIDFNLAYNPYCVYNATYSCPLPPAENQLSVAIPAGEKNFIFTN